MKKRPVTVTGLFWGGQPPLRGTEKGQAAASQYAALNGLLMRNASGETSNNLSVGIFSPVSVVKKMPDKASWL